MGKTTMFCFLKIQTSWNIKYFLILSCDDMNQTWIHWPKLRIHVQWWFVNPDTFVPGQYFRIKEFSALLIRPSVQKRKLVLERFVRISEISGLLEPGLTNHHCLKTHNTFYETLYEMKNQILLATPINTAPGVEFGKNQYLLLLNGKFVF